MPLQLNSLRYFTTGAQKVQLKSLIFSQEIRVGYKIKKVHVTNSCLLHGAKYSLLHITWMTALKKCIIVINNNTLSQGKKNSQHLFIT